VTQALREVSIEWAALSLTQGEVLDAFAAYCDEVDDLTVLERAPERLRLDWRDREQSVVALADGPPTAPPEEPELLITGLSEEVVARYLDDALLRSRLAVYDLGRLEKINAARSSAFVYFEWFLRDLYGVKLLPSAAFTQGLVERGIISLGMG
jgi:hypothetical protein